MSSQTSPDQDESIRLSVPARPDYAQIARLTATSIAARIGFTYDEVEDLRIAVGELCSVFVSEDPARRITITCQTKGDGLTVTGTVEPPAPAVVLPRLSEQILAAVTDRVEVDPDTARITVHKQRQD